MPTLPSFADLLHPDRIVLRDRAGDKREHLRRGAARLATSDAVLDRDRLAADLEGREARQSTGVGEGVALPHTRTPAVVRTVATLATLAEPADWNALDGVPVDLVVTFAGPENEPGRHVRLLAQVSRVLSAPGVRAQLAQAATPVAALDALRDAEQRAR